MTVGLSVALGWGFAGLCGGEPSPGTRGVTRNPSDARGRADDLVRRARQAMAENDWDAAGALITQAETLGAEYGPFHLGDTPQKARRDLERKLSPHAASMPGRLLRPLMRDRNQDPPIDPFAAHNGQLPFRLQPISQ